MASITQYYGIPGPVPFQDVDVSSDNYRFVDPHRIRLAHGPTPFASDAAHALDSFFSVISRAAMSSEHAEQRRALALLQRFNEPSETRLGMAEVGFSGHGAAEDIGERIWTTLTSDLNALLNVGILKRLEHLPLFVEGVDKDLTSDITTRIAFESLASFTEDMVLALPEFARHPDGLAHVERQIWDPEACSWTTRSMELPIPNGKPLVLVPKGWTGRHLLMSPTRFYETSLLSYVQLARAAVLNGKLVMTPKDVLKADSTLARGRETHVRVTMDAHGAGMDLIAEFEGFVARRFDPGQDLAA